MPVRRWAFLLAFAVFWTTPSRSAPLIEPAFVRARPQVAEHLETLISAQQAAAVTPEAIPAVPSPCATGGPPDSVRYTWTDVTGESGYYLFVDGARTATLPPNVTSYESAPGAGAHSYCVVSFNKDGVSNPCCTTGAQTKLSKPQSCNLSGNLSTIHFQWSAVSGAEGYHVYEDGVVVATTPDLLYTTSTPTDDHQFCVEAFATGLQTSDRCCQTYIGNPTPPGSVAPCQATSNLPGQVILTWTDVVHESGYVIQRDGFILTSVPADTTRFLDNNVFGLHSYCVTAVNPAGSGPPCCSDGLALNSAIRSRLSWGSCSPQVNNQNFTAPGIYTLVLSVEGAATTNVGHDSELRIRPAVPDAWRFDDAGCQTGARLSLLNDSLGDSCPAMLGTNPLSITSYYIDVDGSAALRLAVVYDDLSTLPNQRYVLWKIGFDHTHSIAGSDADPATCDGAAVPLNLTVVPQILLTNGIAVAATPEPNDLATTWNGGQSAKVRTQSATWGRVKALYR